MINPTEKFRQNSINFKQTNFKLLDANSKRITHRSDEEQVVPGAVLGECDILNLQGDYTKKGILLYWLFVALILFFNLRGIKQKSEILNDSRQKDL